MRNREIGACLYLKCPFVSSLVELYGLELTYFMLLDCLVYIYFINHICRHISLSLCLSLLLNNYFLHCLYQLFTAVSVVLDSFIVSVHIPTIFYNFQSVSGSQSEPKPIELYTVGSIWKSSFQQFSF